MFIGDRFLKAVKKTDVKQQVPLNQSAYGTRAI